MTSADDPIQVFLQHITSPNFGRAPMRFGDLMQLRQASIARWGSCVELSAVTTQTAVYTLHDVPHMFYMADEITSTEYMVTCNATNPARRDGGKAYTPNPDATLYPMVFARDSESGMIWHTFPKNPDDGYAHCLKSYSFGIAFMMLFGSRIPADALHLQRVDDVHGLK